MGQTQSRGVHSLEDQVLVGWWDFPRRPFIPSFTNPYCPSNLITREDTPGMYNVYLPDCQKLSSPSENMSVGEAAD